MEEKNDITEKLKKMVKKKNNHIVVIKAGSIKHSSKSSSNGFGEDYYPSTND